ncbi:DsbA family protein [Natronorarus salvus]|uniref:DsbA family protein n=1 Tax=Natronorarus salvus TaxID=3117733 RepID=UPI002F26A145
MQRRLPTRREVLLAVGAAGTVGTAGCLGDDGGAEGDCSGEQREVDVPAMGDPDSGIEVEVYEDFACPSCRTYELDVAPEIKDRYVEPGEISYHTHDFPIPVDDTWSWKVPNAALAVLEDAGEEAYVDFGAEVYELQGEYEADSLAALAASHGADEATVREAIDEEPFCEQIVESRQAGIDRGVEGTPTVVVNDEFLEEWSVEAVSDAIEAER